MRSLCLALLATSLHAATPTFEWVAGGGGAKNDKTRAVTFDRTGNVFLAGETTDDGTFGDLKRTGLGGMDFFLAKLSPEGKFLWVRSLGGSLVDRGYGVATDADGNAYVTGHYQSTDAQANGQLLPNAGITTSLLPNTTQKVRSFGSKPPAEKATITATASSSMPRATSSSRVPLQAKPSLAM